MKIAFTLILFFVLLIPLRGQGVQKDGSVLVETVEWNLLEQLITINRIILDGSVEGNNFYFELAKKYVIKCEKFLDTNEKIFTSQEIKQARHYLESKKSFLLKDVSIADSPEEAASFIADNLILKFITQTAVNRDLKKVKENLKSIYK